MSEWARESIEGQSNTRSEVQCGAGAAPAIKTTTKTETENEK